MLSGSQVWEIRSVQVIAVPIPSPAVKHVSTSHLSSLNIFSILHALTSTHPPNPAPPPLHPPCHPSSWSISVLDTQLGSFLQYTFMAFIYPSKYLFCFHFLYPLFTSDIFTPVFFSTPSVVWMSWPPSKAICVSINQIEMKCELLFSPHILSNSLLCFSFFLFYWWFSQ